MAVHDALHERKNQLRNCRFIHSEIDMQWVKKIQLIPVIAFNLTNCWSNSNPRYDSLFLKILPQVLYCQYRCYKNVNKNKFLTINFSTDNSPYLYMGLDK